MKIEQGKITILVGQDRTTIEIKDDKANITFARVVLTPEQLSSALSRLALTPCEIEVFGLDNVGKAYEHKELVFPLSSDDISGRKGMAKMQVWDHCPEGWSPMNSYSSQSSFFHKDGVQWARTTIRRWV